MNESRDRQEVEAIVDNLRLIDDNFMRVVFQNNKECARLVLSVILKDESLTMEEFQTQKELYNLKNHSICADVYAVSDNGTCFDLEIQQDGQDTQAGMTRRVRYYGSMIDVNALNKSVRYRDLPDTQVIFLMENDFYGKGAPIYYVDRMVLYRHDEETPNPAALNSESSLPFSDGEHILMVNGAYKSDTAFGWLMNDFRATRPEQMKYELLRDAVYYFKNTKEGRAIMCRSVEEYGDKREQRGMNQGITQEQRNSIRNLFTICQTAEQIIQQFHYPASLVYEVAEAQ